MRFVVGAGGYIFLPHNVPHGFRGSSDKDSHILVHAIPGSNVGFVGMMLEMAEPLSDRNNLPAATPPDAAKLNSLCKKNGIDVLGPLPE